MHAEILKLWAAELSMNASMEDSVYEAGFSHRP